MIRVIIADDHHLVRQGLRRLLEKAGDIRVIAEASDGEEVIAAVERWPPDVVVMDVEMPGIDGFEATKRIRARHPAIRIVMLSIYSDPRLVHRALQYGAGGYLLKQSSAAELVEAIRTVCRGLRHRSAVVERVEGAPGHSLRLSPREDQVLRLLAQGDGNRRIAETLHISIKTVEKHRGSLMARLDVHGLADLIRTAVKHGLIPLDG